MSNGHRARMKEMERRLSCQEKDKPLPLYVVLPADDDGFCTVIKMLLGEKSLEAKIPVEKLNGASQEEIDAIFEQAQWE